MFETGHLLLHSRAENTALKRYSSNVRGSWNAAAQKLWHEASLDIKESSPEAIRSEIERFRKLELNVDALQASLIGFGKRKPELFYEIVEKLLDYSESHPNDIYMPRCRQRICCTALRLLRSITDEQSDEISSIVALRSRQEPQGIRTTCSEITLDLLLCLDICVKRLPIPR